MLVAASTQCYPEMGLKEALGKLVDLEYSNVELAIHENCQHMKPSEVTADLDAAIERCRDTHRLDIVAYNLDIEAKGEEHYEQFAAICKLAKATKVVTLTVPSAPLGTPFNEEVEHLRELVGIAQRDGMRVGIKTEVGCLSEDPDTVMVLCNNVDGLGVTLDPSHYICGPFSHRSYDKLLKYVYHVQLRDSSKEKLQVRIGQGEVEYGRLVSQLRQFGYDRALCVDMLPLEETDHMGEMRKLRLLLESVL